MKVHIRRTLPETLKGVALGQYQQGRTYEMDATLGQCLIDQGYAVVEMRRYKRSQRPRAKDRRASPITAVYIPEL
jgi:hypothetical protein